MTDMVGSARWGQDVGRAVAARGFGEGAVFVCGLELEQWWQRVRYVVAVHAVWVASRPGESAGAQWQRGG